MAAAGYVIFFHTTVAHGLSTRLEQLQKIVFEEPDPPLPSEPAAQPVKKTSSLPKVAIIIDDMGYHRDIELQLLNLPHKLTFSFLPFGPFTQELEELAYQKGRPILLHLPMQPQGNEWDPGPGALLLGQSMEEMEKLVDENLMAVPHATGINNHMGSLYTADRKAMEQLMGKVRTLGLFFIDSFTSPASLAFPVAQELGVASARRHIFLDNVQASDTICLQLQRLIQIAEEHGRAIGIGHPNEATLQALTSCQQRLLTRVQLVAVSELVSMPSHFVEK